MDEKTTVGRRRRRTVLLAGILALPAVLCLALLTSAQASPVSIATIASPDTIQSGSTVQYTTTFTNSAEIDIEILVVTQTLATGFEFVSMGEASAIFQEPLVHPGTIVWEDGSYSLPASQILVLAHDVQVNAPSVPEPYESLVEARLSTGEVLFSTAFVHVVDGDQDPEENTDPEPVTATPTLTVTQPATEPTPEPVTEPTPEPVIEPTPEPVIEPTPEPVIEPTPEPTPEPVSDSPPVTTTQPVEAPAEEAPARSTDGPYWLYMPLVMRTEPQYRLAYDSDPSGSNWEVYAVDASGANLVNVSNQSGGDVEPAWSPGRTKIAWVHHDGDDEISVANADGSNRQRLTDNTVKDWQPAWSPDGSEIAFTSMRDGDREIYKMNADGSGVQKLTGLPGQATCKSYNPTWSPDGQKIAFICGDWKDDAQVGTRPLHEVYIMSADGTNQRRLTEDNVHECENEDGETEDCPSYEDTGLTWAPDSTWLAYAKYYNQKREKRDKGDIYKINTSLSSPQQINLTNTPDRYMAEHSPDWAPVGDKIAFSGKDGTYEILTMNTDGSNVTNLTHAALADYKPKWSSDATMIAFLSNRVGGSLELYVMNADGSGTKRLTNTSADEQDFSWRP
ncbi:hypothetical protein ACFLUM_01500 [Chloroflexota bacterium]